MRSAVRLQAAFLITFYTVMSAQGSGSWVTIDSLHEPRQESGIVVLPNGNVLVGGGNGITPFLSSCEIYEFNTGKWLYSKSMNVPRMFGNFILLKTGKILSAGGFEERSCEIFDPDKETWTMTDSLPTMRIDGQSTTVLKDGKVLVCGGYRDSADVQSGKTVNLSACEIYDPVISKWSHVAPMNVPRYCHTATLLNNGKVLVAGGFGNTLELRSCEIYDPEANKWTVTASLNEARSEAASILLPNGNVFISGGDSLGAPWKKTCEVFDITGKEWTYVQSMYDARIDHQIYYMAKNNQLLILGGAVGQQSKEDTWETYDPVNLKPLQYGIFPMKKIFFKSNPIKLNDGRIIIAGGEEYDFSKFDGMPYFWVSKTCQLLDITTSVSENKVIPDRYFLCQNYPNPFNPSTEIKYSLSKSRHTRIDVYNTLGQLVRTLVNCFQNAGNYQIQFNAKELPSGVYFYRIISGSYSETKKMLLIK